MTSPRTLSRKSRNLFARINKEFPDGFLPEESSSVNSEHRLMARWPWCETAPSAGNACMVHGVDAELARLEAAIAEAIAEGKIDEVVAEMSASLAVWLKEELTSDGLLHANPWSTYAILPTLYRLRLALTGSVWDSTFEKPFQTVAQAVHRTAWWKGWLFGHPLPPSPAYRRMLQTSLSGPASRRWNLIRRMLWEKEKSPKSTKDEECGFQTDEAKLAILRKDWTVGSPVLAVDFRSRDVALDGRLFGEPFLSGSWQTSIAIDGETIPLDGEWDATCWFADSDGEYLELQWTLAGDVIVARQIFLARRVPLVWFSDTLSVPQAADLQLSWTLPTRNGIELAGELPTRAQKLKGHRFDLRFLPVADPAEPLQPSRSRFSMTDDGLTLAIGAQGVQRLFLPAAFTWSARSLPAPTPWRMLAVTNDRRRIEPDEAVAFRLPIADTQVLFFRALQKPIRYAFVGHQTYSECEIGELTRDGEFTEWLTIEEE